MRRLRFPLVLMFLVLIASFSYHYFYLQSTKGIFTMNSPFTLTAIILTGCFLVLRFLDSFVWEPARNAGLMKTPRLFIDILNAVILAIVVLLLLNRVFSQPLTGILAASGALGVIIGLSMQRLLADIFTGIAVSMDKTVGINDWIEYSTSGGKSYGRVVEVNWRTIKLIRYDNNVVVIPNGVLASESIVNYSRPSTKTMFSIDFVFDFEVPSNRIITLLEAAVLSVPIVLENPPPQVLVQEVTERGVRYLIQFWIDINKTSIFTAKHMVYTGVLNHIHQSGLSLSYSKHDVYYKPMPKRQLDRHRDFSKLLQRVPLFKMLNREELEIIHRGVAEVDRKKGEKVIENGKSGSSMFVVVEGLLDVYVERVKNSAVQTIKVNQLVPGDFFGEMSLLTGEPRSATIIARTNVILFEIKKKSMMTILKGRPQVSKELSKMLAARVMSNKSMQIKYKNDSIKLATSLFQKMKEFFFGV